MRSRWVIALTVLVLVATAGCSQDAPRPKMPTSTSSPPTSEPSTSEPTAEPKEPWQKKSYEGAEAFATRWFDVFSAAMPTGDTSEMRAISDPACANCTSFADLLDSFYEDGGYYKSKGWKVQQATYVRAYPLKKAQVGLSIVTSRARVKKSATAPQTIDTPGRQAYVAELRWSGDGWLMVRFEPVG